MKVFLSGFMGAGKTTVGSLLAAALGWRFVDLDGMIEAEEQKPISVIFAEKGEHYFREREKALLHRVTRGQDALVVALGGGVLQDPDNRQWVKENGVCMYLAVRPETVVRRLAEVHDRPLLARNDRLSRITELFERRGMVYQDTADCTISTDERSPEEIVGRICDFMKHRQAL